MLKPDWHVGRESCWLLIRLQVDPSACLERRFQPATYIFCSFCTTCSHSCSESIIYPTSYLLLSEVTVCASLDLSLSRPSKWQHNLCSPSFTKACRSSHRDVTESSKHKDYTQRQFRNLCRGAVIFSITILSIKKSTFNNVLLNLKAWSRTVTHAT